MEVWLESSLLKERKGDRIRAAALASGWSDGKNGSFIAGEGNGRLSLLSIPCDPASEHVTAVCEEMALPEEAIMAEKALLEGYDEPGFCPNETTLIAGELLALPGESENQLFERVLSGWDWWMDLRASSRELAISWGAPPNKDLLFLFNRLDAGFLDEYPQQPLAAGKVTRLVGFHPSTVLLGKSANVPVIGPTNESDIFLTTQWAVGTESIWKSLININKTGQ